MDTMKQARISRGGQISVPAAIRRRWGTDRVLVDDRGDEFVVRPLADDRIAAARGFVRPFATEDGSVPASEEARRQTRDEEAGSDRRTSR
jgi:bifunctional DNA-binding transcriptional regulator/antitoxin component of YhaV-PrlF toxin-antitoxin module